MLENRQNQKMKNKKVTFLTTRQIYTKNFEKSICELATIIYPKLFISVKTLLWYCANLAKPLPIKCPFRSILQKLQRTVILRSVGQNAWNFHQTLLLIMIFNKCISKFTAVFLCLLLSCCQLYQVNRNSKFDDP